MKVLGLAALFVLGSSVARAESPPNPCEGDWWQPTSPVPTVVSGLPPEPVVLLPASWSQRGGDPPSLSESALEVTVEDALGAPVAGAVGAEFPELGGHWETSLRGQLWWRPAAPLAPGAYTARVIVRAPPAGDRDGCGYTGFERTVQLDVSAEAASVVPRATTAVGATVFQEDTLVYATACEREDFVGCADEPDVCCGYRWPGDTYGLDTVVEVETDVPGGAYYQVLEVVVHLLGETEDVTWAHWVWPVPDAPWIDHQQFFPAPFQRPYTITRCATTRLWSLHERAVVSTSNDCAQTADAERLPPPGPIVCDPDQCAAERPEVEPEPVERVEPADDEAEEAVADPDPTIETRDGGGCAGGPGPIGGLAGLFAPLVVILAGGRSSRFGRDKARVEVRGTPSLARVRAAAQQAVGAERVVVHDEPAGGPLGAILESFGRWPGRDLIVLACDVPLIDAETIRVLAAPLDDGDARVARVEGRAQPLAAHYRTSAEVPLRAAWDAGERSIVRALDRLRVAWLDAPPDRLVDFDTPADLLAIEAGAEADRQGADQPSRYADEARNAGSG
ncbi:MAG: molybdenum cofactor guanylyltransferase [Deltaproteobacteria bacterium]|nr:molybdenum cofactor guanylyltransferase [Deltaproteobacteria bacterium]